MGTTMFSRAFVLAIWLDLVFLASTDQCDGNHHDYSMTKEDCGKCDDRHWFSRNANCMKCPKCDAGWGLEQSCGNGKGNDLSIGCVPCDPGKHLYSDKYDDKQCKSSPKCHEFYRSYIKVATSESPAICGDCLNGYFIPSYMDFHPDRITECDPCSLATSDEDLRVCSEGDSFVEYEEERISTSFSNTRVTKNETLTDQPFSNKPKSFPLPNEAIAGILAAVTGSAVFAVLFVTVVLRRRQCRPQSGSVSSTSTSQSDDAEVGLLDISARGDEQKEQFHKACGLLKASPSIGLGDLNKDVRDKLCKMLNVDKSYTSLAHSVFDENTPKDNFYEFNENNLPKRCHDVFERFIIEKNLSVLELLQHMDKIKRAAARDFLAAHIIDLFWESESLATKQADEPRFDVIL